MGPPDEFDEMCLGTTTPAPTPITRKKGAACAHQPLSPMGYRFPRGYYLPLLAGCSCVNAEQEPIGIPCPSIRGPEQESRAAGRC